MSDTDTSSTQRIRDRLASHQLLVTGSTGFLAKVFVEKLLRSVDTIGGIHLLVRARPGGASPAQRVTREVLGSRAFDRLRAVLGERFTSLCEEKIHVIPGDLARERFGLDRKTYERLTSRITLVVNSAATVTFDERLDLAVELNALGPSRLLQFAKDCGQVPFLHVSTCYVCGARGGTIVEDFSAPEPAREKLPRDREKGSYDLDELVRSLREEATALGDALGPDTESCRRALIDAGMARARSLGWNDTYTFTKWIGEQLLVRDHGEVPVVILRPAIIESSYEQPAPGWIDGLRMADPLIVAYGKGKLRAFPAQPKIVLDLIPVDFVVHAMIAALPVGEAVQQEPLLYQCASSGRHPLPLSRLREYLERAFIKRPMNDDEGRPIQPLPLRVVDVETFTKRLRATQRRLITLRRLLERFHFARARVRKLAGIARRIDQLLYFSKIYSPYTHLDCRFSDDALVSLRSNLHPDDQTVFPFDVTDIDWEDYLINRHVPGIRSFVLGTGSEPSARIRAVEQERHANILAGGETLQGQSLFEVFERAARKFPDKTAFQIRRANRWVRYSYHEALCATGTIMRRLNERGLGPGDCLAICGENGPQWSLSYLAIMRAGMTAVPLDPQLPPAEVWSAVRFTGARLVLAGASTLEGIRGKRDADDPAVIAMAQPFVPPPTASLDPLPDPVPAPPSAVASILFTSGTTVAPKAVPLTHRNFIANASALIEVHPVRPTDQFLSLLPMYHAFEFTGGFVVPIASGATITYVEHLKGPEIRSVMRATGTTVMLVVPRLVRMFHHGIRDQVASAGRMARVLFRVLELLSKLTGRRGARLLFRSVHRAFGGKLRMLVSGGSRLDPELFEAFSRMGFAVYEGYGLTETAPVLSVNPLGAARAGSVGPALPNVKIEIRNQNLEGIGEIWVQGPNILSGYLKNPEATAEILTDGWLRTGDLGKLDENGFLFLTGRTKDLIITDAGKNVYPDEVEWAYRDLSLVKELCVFGMPSSSGSGDIVHAVVVADREAAAELDPSSLEREIRLAAETISLSVPSHQRISILHFWDRELPKTSTLKAKRNLIRDMVQAEGSTSGQGLMRGAGVTAGERHSGEPLVDNPSAFAATQAILARQAKCHEADIQKSMHLLLDLGIDSIGKMEVLAAVEGRFDMRINDAKAAGVARVYDLLHLIGQRKPKGAAHVDKLLWQRRLQEETPSAVGNGRLAFPLVPLRWIIRSGVGVFMSTYIRVAVHGRENIPEKGAFILAPNHSSHLDSPAMIQGVEGKRRIWIAGAEDYFFSTRFKRFLFGKVLDTIAIDRKADGVAGLRRCREALQRGEGLLIFAEGTRSVSGELQPFKIGMAVLAVERNVPIVPVYIHRAYDLLRKGQRFVRPGTITVTFGSPVYPPPAGEESNPYAAFRSLTDQVEKAVVALRAEATA